MSSRVKNAIVIMEKVVFVEKLELFIYHHKIEKGMRIGIRIVLSRGKLYNFRTH
jgi:hypothetical protein